MSADIGEPGHELTGWTHSMCDFCWNERHPDRQTNHQKDDHPMYTGMDKCCYCGSATCGIYVRQKATEVHK